MITQDPDTGWFNLGAYRAQVYDGKTVGCQITEGKHGRIHRDKYFERGQSMKVAIVCGQDPLLFMLSPARCPRSANTTSPADCAASRSTCPRAVHRLPDPRGLPRSCWRARRAGPGAPEGPFGEWMGYYSDDTEPRPYVDVKTILYRNDPILSCAPQHKPSTRPDLLKGIAGAARDLEALEASGVPGNPRRLEPRRPARRPASP